MLSIVLMRAIESGMLEETKKWLECTSDWDLKNLTYEQREKEKEERIFHIVIDELHLYRGTPGTEISYLLSKVLMSCGFRFGETIGYLTNINRKKLYLEINFKSLKMVFTTNRLFIILPPS